MFNSDELQQVTRPIRKFLMGTDLLDLCINKPGEVFLYSSSGWERHDVSAIDDEWILTFIQVATVHAKQKTDKTSPILSTTLFSGERLQAIIPPAAKYPCITIRRPSDQLFTLDQLKEQGAFDVSLRKGKDKKTKIKRAKALYEQGDMVTFFRFCVRAKLNIIISGATGSGKTTATKALILEIPKSERIITIEDAEELDMKQPNVVKLFYARSLDNDSIKSVTPKDLLVSCLRMRPDRILLSEIRDTEAYFYLRNVNSGHPGSITSIHSNSPLQALEQLTLMIRQTPAGASMSKADIMNLVSQLVDVVVQWDRWKMTDICFPALEEVAANV